jgi:hypothetical protein
MTGISCPAKGKTTISRWIWHDKGRQMHIYKGSHKKTGKEGTG